MKAKFIDNAKNLQALQARLRQQSQKSVYVGLLAEDGAAPKTVVEYLSAVRNFEEQERAGEPKTLIEVAVINEFGKDGVPKRSFLRGWVDQNRKQIREQIVKTIILDVKQSGLENLMLNRTLGLLGVWGQGQIQAFISNRIPPPNAPYTIEKKGSDVPLIDTGQLRSSISWKVAP